MIRGRVPALVLVWLIATSLVVAGCRTGEATGTVGPDGGVSSGGPGATLPDEGASTEPIATEPELTSIPGYDGWLTLNPTAVDVGQTITGFAMTLTKQAAWSDSSRGVLFYTTIDGDFRLTATVLATRTSDSSLDPGGDGTTQLAGLMARHEGSSESWILLEVGGKANGLTIATDSTTDGVGQLVASSWNDNGADLKVCRIGSTFTFWARAANSDDDWAAAGHVVRKDLAGTVQVGASLSADGTPDLTGLFDNLTVEPVDPGEAC